MKEISRYTKGKFGRIEKNDSGEFVYYIHHNDEITKLLELKDKLSKNNEFLYEQYESLKQGYSKEFDKYCKMSDDLLNIETIQSKKYFIIASVALLFNSGLIGYILWMN